MENKLKAYQELYAVAEKNKEHLCPYLVDDILQKLHTTNLSFEFQLPLEYAGNTWYKVERFYQDWVNVGLYGEETSRTISWSDDGKQPENEWLYAVRFCTGAYIFGDSYPAETFNAFFAELKSFEPKYCDTVNNALYFADDVAKVVYDNFWPIFKKYKALVGEELKAKRKAELEKELATLNGDEE